ncbi:MULTISPECIES: alpha/beta hydrolase [unclassified Gemella]|uniref:alpha/beta hydrolase n=1 Tax=unclassified Gemella TaxID=2624949 RepID=UPI0015D08DC4|nr:MULTISPECIES: alpha/beta hydrolase [unclassified Gemella]MBF0710647.1 alpha/beta hydrolase [Gemella sp. GL1.1]NYS27991.1 alpha/beta hydrolase [Gemella sp. GL1]
MYTKLIKLLNFLSLLASTSLLIFFNKHRLVSIILIILIFLRLISAFHKNESCLIKISILSAFASSLFLYITDTHILILRLATFLSLYSSIILFYDLIRLRSNNKVFFSSLLKIILYLITIAFIFVSLSLNFFTHYPRFLIILGQELLGAKVTASRESYISKNNHLIHKNLLYPSNYENNVLDIYQATDSKATLFFVHGGGYSVYDKSHRIDYLIRFVNSGYNVININYSLFPNNAYPDTTKQVLDAYSFIIDNAEIFNIDKNKIMLSGDSAGGQLAGQLALLLSNSEYANEMGIQIKEAIKEIKPLAYIGIATMFDPTTANQTNLAPINWLYDTVLRSYFSSKDLKNSTNTSQASILNHVTKDFPSSFISDGNLATFDYQARDFDKKLKSLGVESELYLIETENIIQHGFELDANNPYAQDIFEKQIKFMDKQVKDLD